MDAVFADFGAEGPENRLVDGPSELEYPRGADNFKERYQYNLC